MRRQPLLDIGEDRLMYRQLDRLPGLLLRIVDSFGDPVDLTEFTVKLAMRRVSGVSATNAGWSGLRQVTIRDAEEGLIFYDMQAEDTNTDPGEFELTAIIFDANDKRVATAPTQSNAFIQVNSNADTDLLVERFLSTNLDIPIVLMDGTYLTVKGVPGNVDPETLAITPMALPPMVGATALMV